MKATIEFNLPDDQEEFENYQKGLKLHTLMFFWIQEAKWKVDSMTAFELLEDLKQEIANEKIELL